MPEVTVTFRLAETILGTDLQAWISERRRTGRSWRLIARDLYEATDRQIDVTHETVRTWAQAVEARP